jgi:hypothetical protein
LWSVTARMSQADLWLDPGGDGDPCSLPGAVAVRVAAVRGYSPSGGNALGTVSVSPRSNMPASRYSQRAVSVRTTSAFGAISRKARKCFPFEVPCIA